MLAQVVLTPVESKKLIAKAVASLDAVKRAAKKGLVFMHPSSSTYFIFKELAGEEPQTNYWVCGSVTPKGTCVEMAMVLGGYAPPTLNYEPTGLKGWWAIKKGKSLTDATLGELTEQMTENDVFIKGVNALDMEGHVGVLIGDPMQGGSLGVVLSAWRKKKFNLVYPVGLEKLIPVPVNQAMNEAKQAKYEYGMGLTTGLFACPDGIKITEVDAIEILSGAVAIPIAAGGLGGAEGAIILVLKGTDEQVKKAIEFVEQSKGAKLPPLRLCSCNDCPVPHCRFPVKGKPWV